MEWKGSLASGASQQFITHHQVCEQLVQLVKARAGIAAPVVQAVSLGGQSFASG